jgi:hypothetical protein
MPGPDAPLRGRAAERELLRSRIAAASRDGRGSVVLLSGAAGTGKSRLLQEARTLALDAGAQVLLVRGDPDSRVAPHGPVLDAVLAGSQPFVPTGVLDELLPGPDQGHRLRRELHHRLEQASLQGPVLVCIDDLQWCDRETLRLVRLLTSDLSTEAVVWVVAVRPKADPAVRSTVRDLREAGADLTELRPLGAPAVAQISADVLGGLPDQQVLASAAERRDPAPARRAAPLDCATRASCGWRPARLGWSPTSCPARLRDAVARRTERVSADAQAAAADRSRPRPALPARPPGGGRGRPVPTLLGPVQELVDAAPLHDDGEQLAFGHDLIRETVAADLPQAFARTLRRHTVDVLLARGASTVQVAAMLADSAVPGDVEAVAALRDAAAALGPHLVTGRRRLRRPGAGAAARRLARPRRGGRRGDHPAVAGGPRRRRPGAGLHGPGRRARRGHRGGGAHPARPRHLHHAALPGRGGAPERDRAGPARPAGGPAAVAGPGAGGEPRLHRRGRRGGRGPRPGGRDAAAPRRTRRWRQPS